MEEDDEDGEWERMLEDYGREHAMEVVTGPCTMAPRLHSAWQGRTLTRPPLPEVFLRAWQRWQAGIQRFQSRDQIAHGPRLCILEHGMPMVPARV